MAGTVANHSGRPRVSARSSRVGLHSSWRSRWPSGWKHAPNRSWSATPRSCGTPRPPGSTSWRSRTKAPRSFPAAPWPPSRAKRPAAARRTSESSRTPKAPASLVGIRQYPGRATRASSIAAAAGARLPRRTSRWPYVVDGFAGWDPEYRIKVRVVCSRAYHALFMHNLLIRPTPEELERLRRARLRDHQRRRPARGPAHPGRQLERRASCSTSTAARW